MIWVGTYAAKGGKGLYAVGNRDGALSVGPPEPRIANASYAIWSPATRTAYFVDEQADGRVAGWRWGGGGWTERGGCATGGALPCYLALHPDNGFLAVANYGAGSVALIALDQASGRVIELADVAQLTGKGVDLERQDGPHAHCVVFDERGESLFHVDLGLDRVFRHRLENGRLGNMKVAFEAPPGSGPRHLAFHPDGQHALLLTELSGELLLLRREGEALVLVDSVQTLPEPHDDNLGGHLAVEGSGQVFVTNRGHDSLVAFTLADGRLERRGWAPTGEASPRHFHLGAGHILIAHEEGGAVSLVPRLLAATDGPVQRVSLPGAVFILEIPD
jgi:6-phosphogluconolactonase